MHVLQVRDELSGQIPEDGVVFVRLLHKVLVDTDALFLLLLLQRLLEEGECVLRSLRPALGVAGLTLLELGRLPALTCFLTCFIR